VKCSYGLRASPDLVRRFVQSRRDIDQVLAIFGVWIF